MPVPVATYRVQLHSGFTLQHLQQILPYLKQLGISTVYASPITQSVKGSVHGYDVTNALRINPEIGTLEELEAITAQLKDYGMSWLQDIVPNHMAFDTSNAWIREVLEEGPHSQYSHYFDINWNHPDDSLKGKLMVPFLGEPPEELIRKGELRVAWQNSKGEWQYAGNSYPLSLPAYAFLESVNSSSEKAVAQVNADPSLLLQLLQEQYYALSWWRNTSRQINYRRFFTVNSLICLRMEDKAVFDEYHTLIVDLYKKGWIQGVRIDHMDGLYNPRQYVQWLRDALGEEAYIIAEKILERHEPFPRHWPLQGTSGYEFLGIASQLLTNRQGAEQLLQWYRQQVPYAGDYESMVFKKKHHFLLDQMNGELDNLLRYLRELELIPNDGQDELKEVLGLWMAALPVYRLYPEQLPLNEAEQQLVKKTFDTAMPYAPGLQSSWRLLQSLFEDEGNATQTEKKVLFLRRLMQFTGPLAAKGVEDTVFYVYNPLIAHNEVGDSPSMLGSGVEDFHAKMQERQQLHPCSLNATSTHDTKRGEDARMRIALLSELPGEWQRMVQQWQQLNAPLLQNLQGRRAPSVNDEYFIYQSLIGSFPEELEVTQEFLDRSKAFITKALREAKVETNYDDPDEAYEQACIRFIETLLSLQHGFLNSFVPFLEKLLDDAGILSLVQTLLKITAPGIPDIYQGCELWDTSYVDPDNRRPVDFSKRVNMLQALNREAAVSAAAALQWAAAEKRKGAQKMYLIRQALAFRQQYPALFAEGSYIPLQVSQPRMALAYARRLEQQWVVIVVPLGFAGKGVAAAVKDTTVTLPEDAPAEWQNVFTGTTLQAAQHALPVSAVLDNFPVGLLVGGE